MNSSYAFARAVRGPIVLIVLGALFVAEYQGGPQFSRTWPVLIIVIGVMKLLERSLARPQQQVPAPYRGDQTQ
ncbi:MAG: LiaI-LiaF-like domain-containing protein [Bryobacteraceae bacterium]